MKPKLKNPYGYKICYKKQRDKEYHLVFMTKTYPQAKKIKKADIKHLKLKKTVLHILPITKIDIKHGIWRGPPW